MKPKIAWLSLASFLLTILLNSASSIAPYNRAFSSPILNMPNRIKLTGDPTGEWDSNWTVLQSPICFKSRYSCFSVGHSSPSKDSTLGSDRYAIQGRSLDSVGYPYKYEIKTLLEKGNIIHSIALYASPRPETGLINWEISLIDTVMKASLGKSINRVMLNKCYLINKDDSRENCVVQRGKVNDHWYYVKVDFINLETAPGEPWLPSPYPNLRNFVLRILPE